MKFLVWDQREKAKELFLQISILLLLFLFESLGLTQPITAVGEQVINPMLILTTKVVYFTNLPLNLARKSYKSAKKIQDLERRYSETLAMLGEIEALREENKELRAILASTDRDLSEVIVTSPIVSYASPAVAAGKQEGVEAGMMVLSHGTLLAVVEKSFEHHASITLLYQKKLKPILAKTESGIQGLIKGDGKNVLLTELPVDAEINLGDRVLTLGQAGIKKDIFIGKVRAIKSDPSASVKTAVLEQYINFYTILIVEIK
ncbi:MAG: rod shape-determining protein MreC [Candidatus Woesebacteria bacterium]|jgi:cell shape-determining protein MreC